MSEQLELPHHCHWPGCPIVVEARYWGCNEHWHRLPKRIRDEIMHWARTTGIQRTKSLQDAERWAHTSEQIRKGTIAHDKKEDTASGH